MSPVRPQEASSADPSADRMGTEPVLRLLVSFSLPCIIGMLVNALYNIVDRIFVGQGVGEQAIAATTVAFPLMLALISFSVLVGVGANTLFSIRLGEGDREATEVILGNALSLLILCPLVAFIPLVVWLDPLLRFLGASEEVLPMARTYSLVILAAAPVGTAGMGLSHFIRSDGHPRAAMVSMLIGGILNTVLDPLFIFAFRWGIAGAAWATVISQLASFAYCMAYFLSPRFPSTPLRRRALRLRWRTVVGPFLAMGFAPCAMNLANSLLNIVLNKSLVHYGGDTALAVMGILASYMGIIFTPVFGLMQGAQPLMGYNYGARHLRRVRGFFWGTFWISTAVLCVGTVLSQAFPRLLLRCFVREPDGALLGLGVRCLRLYTMAFPLIGFHICSGNLFQSMGRPVVASVLSLSRQVLLFIPCLVLLPLAWGLDGVFLAGPASDVLSFLLAVGLAWPILRGLRRGE